MSPVPEAYETRFQPYTSPLRPGTVSMRSIKGLLVAVLAPANSSGGVA